jgi:hypothetical protein
MIAAAESIQREYAERGEPVFQSIEATIGGRTSLFGGPGSSSTTTIASNAAQIQIQLTPSADRTTSSSELEALWRATHRPAGGRGAALHHLLGRAAGFRHRL